MGFLNRTNWGVLVIVAGISSASGWSDDKYGAAPQSLDLYTLDPQTENEVTRAEKAVSGKDPFQGIAPPSADPQNGKPSDRIVVGPTLRLSKRGGFDAYRYVTYLSLEEKKERLYDLPIHHQECTTKASVFADYDYSTTIETEVDSHLSLEVIGLAKKGEPRSKRFTVKKLLKAIPRTIVDHLPFVVKKSARGRSYLQLIRSSTGEVRTVVSANEKGIDLDSLFPSIFGGKEIYPLPVEVRDLDWTFVVEQKPVRKCTTAELREAMSKQRTQASL